MKEHPILFKAEMIRAIQDGRKTQTRRMVKPQPAALDALWPNDSSHVCWHDIQAAPEYYAGSGYCPQGAIGDTLWVKETFSAEGAFGTNGRVLYRADIANGKHPSGLSWKPSIFMPHKASRIALEITGIKVERVQDISEEDALAEGMPKWEENECMRFPHEEFMVLWNNLYANWDANPWVWAITFKKI